ncbi:membrane or secreted protein [Winogradskyella aurantiaca]|uniref:membrane or secreted protein n=1 Tax=Winogradskyella aurantiaca TaxID=2219558 RepID=UPI000E1D795F|nr:membrane or secreted protein [Winogradskyella aurantiaca]
MKVLSFILLTFLVSLFGFAQSPIGAWETSYKDSTGEDINMIVIFSEGYQVATHFKSSNGEFVQTNGGSWSLEGFKMTEIVEFDNAKPERVGSEVSFEIEFPKNTQMKIKGHDLVLDRIDSGTPGELHGAWLMSGRKRNGETQQRDTTKPRKTMKILSGTRFQWIAYNTETKEFKGTGGGTYTTVDGNYTESIEFFSRDNSRVGANLDFNYKLVDGHWHHSGLSSKGQPLYEIWSLRN